MDRLTRTEDGDSTSVEVREAAYWDAQASQISDSDLAAECVKSEPLDECRKRLLGDLTGKKVLDVGCGMGLWSAYLATSGAEVWAIDISPQSVEMAKRRAILRGVGDRVTASVMSAMDMQFPDGYFDVVHGQDIIHHLDADKFGREVQRVLACGGRAVFSENCANNPVLMFARNQICGRWGIPKWSSDDEYPLTRARLKAFSQFFQECTVEYPEFVCFHFVDAKLFRYKNRFVSWACHGMDHLIYCALPVLRPLSYRQVICCRE
jgi:ubiquinone/menaquinone biosynthesis C-methylase UbiE